MAAPYKSPGDEIVDHPAPGVLLSSSCCPILWVVQCSPPQSQPSSRVTLLPLTVSLVLSSIIFNAHLCQDGKFTGQQNSGSGVISFRGIRYADAPVGNLRWRAPVSPPSKNLGNVDATSVRFHPSQLVYAGSYFDSSPPHACRRRRKSQKPTSCSSTRPTRWTATLKTAYS